ncbi:hypothetical protein B0H11DRAFT_2292282 [Mycena galericulata]|nr:hypothetical protein B0H11DRAFT_2292282 [Mycena galericulata]
MAELPVYERILLHVPPMRGGVGGDGGRATDGAAGGPGGDGQGPRVIDSLFTNQVVILLCPCLLEEVLPTLQANGGARNNPPPPPGTFWLSFFPIGALFSPFGGAPTLLTPEFLGLVIFTTLASLTILSFRPSTHIHRGAPGN